MPDHVTADLLFDRGFRYEYLYLPGSAVGALQFHIICRPMHGTIHREENGPGTR